MYKKHIYGNLIIIAIWYLLSLFIGTRLVPFPHTVVINIFTNFGDLLPHLGATLFRLVIGFAIALSVGVTVGIAMGMNKKVDNLLSPLIYCLNPIPKSALTPVFLIIFGMNDIGRVMIIIAIIIFPIIISIKDAIVMMPEEYFIIAQTLNLSKLEFYTKIISRAILPNLLSTIKVTIAIAIAVLYFVEQIGSSSGLGYYIASNNGVNNVEMYSGIVILSLIGYIVVVVMDLLLEKKCNWK